MSKACEYCGTTLEEDDICCPECGASMEEQNSSEDESDYDSDDES